jgi:hypothetical protein
MWGMAEGAIEPVWKKCCDADQPGASHLHAWYLSAINLYLVGDAALSPTRDIVYAFAKR